MKKIVLSLLFLSPFFVCSQTKKEAARIVKSYDVEALNSLHNDFRQMDELRASLIEEYLAKNPQVRRSYTVNKVFYEIVDIVDNQPVYRSTDNASAAKATKTAALHNGGELGLNIEGQNMLVGVWDGGFALKSHVEFMNDDAVPVTRVTTPQTPNPNPATSDHGTHVMGTIIAKGVNAAAKGMAPKASALSYNWTNDLANVTTEITNRGLLLSNHSYGVPVKNDDDVFQPAWMMGCYHTNARAWDQLAYTAPYYLMVASAGNSGADEYTGGLAAGYDKLTTDKTAKNNLVVANSNPFVLANGTVNLFPINSSSSQGPTDDGRIKPDIAGDGTNLFSSVNTNNTSYATFSGTSMAAPNVTGSLLLLQQYYNQLNTTYMKAATLKGLVCHTARDGGSVGPDPKFGWGLLDTKKAAEVIQKDNAGVPTAIISELVLNQGESYTIQVGVSNLEKLEATISWTDPAGTSRNNILNDPTPVLVNDLDLRITKDADTFFPWKLQLSNVAAPAIKGDNIVDNIEKVEVTAPDGVYTITVSHKGTLSSGQQAFSLIVTGSDLQNLGTNDFSEDKILVYPNPAGNTLNVNFGTAAPKGYEIYDAQGRMVVADAVKNLSNFTIDLSPLQPGVYIVKFIDGNKSLIKKIIKK